jgi:hypothetical protein
MQLVNRTHPHMKKYLSLLDTLGVAEVQHRLERRLYCQYYNRPRHGENQVFKLRPATAPELSRFDPRHESDPIVAATVSAIREFIRVSFPVEVANFRIVRDHEDKSKAYMSNMYGENSPSNGLDYYRPKSARTLLVRALSSNCYWHGPASLIQSFSDFCLNGDVAMK